MSTYIVGSRGSSHIYRVEEEEGKEREEERIAVRICEGGLGEREGTNQTRSRRRMRESEGGYSDACMKRGE